MLTEEQIEKNGCDIVRDDEYGYNGWVSRLFKSIYT